MCTDNSLRVFSTTCLDLVEDCNKQLLYTFNVVIKSSHSREQRQVRKLLMSVRKRLSGSKTQTDGQARNFVKAAADRRVTLCSAV